MNQEDRNNEEGSVLVAVMQASPHRMLIIEPQRERMPVRDVFLPERAL
jgi:hypothetical protein